MASQAAAEKALRRAGLLAIELSHVVRFYEPENLLLKRVKELEQWMLTYGLLKAGP